MKFLPFWGLVALWLYGIFQGWSAILLIVLCLAIVLWPPSLDPLIQYRARREWGEDD